MIKVLVRLTFEIQENNIYFWYALTCFVNTRMALKIVLLLFRSFTKVLHCNSDCTVYLKNVCRIICFAWIIICDFVIDNMLKCPKTVGRF